jgi:ubiquinone/menaquinone biosynthesis C-methylase UbiE
VNDVYTHGHHDSVLRSHRWRTAANSAGYLLAHLRPGMSLLDVGCGPGTITADLARRLAPGRVVGLDREARVIAEAAQLREQDKLGNLQFGTGDAYALPVERGSFDVVHAHQVLQHLSDPVAALVEMRAVLRDDGLLAARDSDYGGFVWAPSHPLLDRWRELYVEVCRRNGADAHAGRNLLAWVQAAGFREIRAGSSTWTFAEPSERTWWAELWAERVTRSSLAEQAIAYGLSTIEELRSVGGAWREWATHDAAFYVVLHGEILARA